MAKEKIQVIENKNNERIFHYEILGIVLLILSMICIAKLGLVGQYLMITIKLLFGDWYFLVILLAIAYSIRCIILHKKLKINSTRYLGIFILILSLILLSHFSMHKYVSQFKENSLKLTLSLYFSYFRIGDSSSIVGGGVIGCLLFYMFYYLFSGVGVVLLSIVMIFLGIVFICKKTIKDFIKMIFNFFKKIIKKIKKTSTKINNVVDTFDESYKIQKVKYKVYKPDNIDLFKNENNNAKININKIKKILNQMNIFYNNINYLVCRNVTIYFISSHYAIQIKTFENYLNNEFSKFQIKYDNVKKEIILEICNSCTIPLRLNEIEVSDEEELCFGIDDRNNFLNLEYFNNKLLIVGNNYQQLSYYLDSIILGIMHKKIKLNYYFLDLYNCAKLSTSNTVDEISNIINIINERINKISRSGYNDFKKYNINTANTEVGEVIVINGIDKYLTSDKEVQCLKYILQTTNQYGFIFIFTVSSNNNFVDKIINLFDYKVFLDNHLNYSSKILGFQRFDLLESSNEAYLSYKNIIIRMTLLLMHESEYNSIKK